MAPRSVIGPLGNVLTLTDLPSPDTLRWSRRRKGEILAAVEGGLLTPEKACSTYNLSMDELLAWRDAVAQCGLAGLCARRPREPKREDPLRLQQFILREINRLMTVAHAMGAAHIAVLLEKAAAEVGTMQAPSQDEQDHQNEQGQRCVRATQIQLHAFGQVPEPQGALS
jgi:Protein of unknown function (DUF1153)